MSRYFTRPTVKQSLIVRALWVADDVWVEPLISVPSVPEHEATDTGLLDQHGKPIMRAANPMGFGRDEEW